MGTIQMQTPSMEKFFTEVYRTEHTSGDQKKKRASSASSKFSCNKFEENAASTFQASYRPSQLVTSNFKSSGNASAVHQQNFASA